MHSVTLKFKDGTTREEVVWYWKPTEGWFTIAGEYPEKQYWMSDLESAICHDERVSAGVIGDEDMLEHARETRKWHFDRGECPSLEFPPNPEKG